MIETPYCERVALVDSRGRFEGKWPGLAGHATETKIGSRGQGRCGVRKGDAVQKRQWLNHFEGITVYYCAGHPLNLIVNVL